MKASYIDHMGTDISVINAARVSFSTESEWGDDGRLKAKDVKLLKYLAKHNHWSPFAHTSVCIHLKMPFFVARQIDKHQVGFVVNEVSRRYVDFAPEFYSPNYFRKSAENVKQGSSEEEIDYDLYDEYELFLTEASNMYNRLLDAGTCAEQARLVLPMATFTEQYKTGSLYAWSRLYNLRTDPHAQKETQELAAQIGEIVRPLFPESWSALTGELV